MVEYIVGPIIALLLGMKFTDYKVKELSKRVEDVSAQCEARLVESNTRTSKTLIATLTPVAKSIQTLNEQVGIQ